MPTSTQASQVFHPQRLKFHSYRQQTVSPSDIDAKVDTLPEVSTKEARRGAGALFKSPWLKAVLGVLAVAVVGTAIGVPVALTLAGTTTTTAVTKTSTTATTATTTTATTTTTTSVTTTTTATTSTSTSTSSTSTTSTTTSTTSTTSTTTSSTSSTSTSTTSTSSTSTTTTTSTTTSTTSTTSSTSSTTSTTTSTSTSTTSTTSSTSSTTSTTTSTSTSTTSTTSTTRTTSTTSSTSTTSTTSTTTTTTVTVTLPPTYMFWAFDSNYNDLYNVYNGIGVNSPSFVSPGYNGYGSALSLNATNSQYVLVTNFKNMTYTSFTWEMWAYPRNLENYDCLMVGMCQTPSLRRCLYLMIRQNSTYFAFYADDCWSTLFVTLNQWHHFAFVYDYTAMAQYIYLNGVLTCSHGSSGPFMATAGAITIGAINNTGTTPSYFWTGYLDDVQYVSRAKTASEILDDATLVAYYSFDNASFIDRGPNRINGTGANVTFATGRVNQGILLNANGQYFTASGFTLLGSTYRPYSISLWIYRSSPAQGSGTILHMSASPNGLGWCLPIIGLTTSNQIVGQNWNSTGAISIVGPVVQLTTWTHVVTSYSSTNGVRLWVNGTLIGSSGPFAYGPSTVANTISLGNSPNGPSGCATGLISFGQFYGMVDEVRVYSRELAASDVATLANP